MLKLQESQTIFDYVMNESIGTYIDVQYNNICRQDDFDLRMYIAIALLKQSLIQDFTAWLIISNDYSKPKFMELLNKEQLLYAYFNNSVLKTLISFYGGITMKDEASEQLRRRILHNLKQEKLFRILQFLF